jgi:hypothetical protein
MLLAGLCMGTAQETNQVQALGSSLPKSDDIREIALPQPATVLAPYSYELETGASYLRNRYSLPGAVSDTVRTFTVPVAARLGILPSLEATAYVPFSSAEREVVTSDTSDSESDTGIGDCVLGFNAQLIQEGVHRPDCVLSVTASLPTGSDPYENGGNPVPLGSGHTRIGVGLQFVRTSDPLVLYGGPGFSWRSEEDTGDQTVKLGNSLGYNFGCGFAVNPDISLNAQFVGGYQEEVEVDGESMDGTSQEPMVLRISLTSRWYPRTYVEPYLNVGLNDDAADASFGFSIITRSDL